MLNQPYKIDIGLEAVSGTHFGFVVLCLIVGPDLSGCIAPTRHSDRSILSPQ